MRDSETKEAKHAWQAGTSKNLSLDREGHEGEYEPEYLRKIADYYKKMALIRESSLPMQKDLYGGIERAITRSGFHKEDNELTDFYSGFEQTDAAIAMQDGINEYFSKLKFPVKVIVVSLDELSFGKNKPRLQDETNPNRFVVGAQASLDKNGDGLIYLMAVTSVEDFDSSKIDPAVVAKKASTVMRHELMHDRQYTSLASDMGITKGEAKQKFEDWGLIPPEGAAREEYLGSHIEIDAFGHEFAEELAQKFGLKKAKDLVASANSSTLRRLARSVDDDMSDNFREYFDLFSDARFTAKLRKKIKKYLNAFEAENIYRESVRKRVITRLVNISSPEIITGRK